MFCLPDTADICEISLHRLEADVLERMLPYPSVLTVQLLSLLLFCIMVVGWGPIPLLFVPCMGFMLPLSPIDIFSILLLISPIAAVCPRLGIFGTLGCILFLILLAIILVLKPASPNSPPPMAAATAISRSASSG